jgi:hypothetical protein
VLTTDEESLIWREVDGEVIVLDKRTWSYLAINGSGALLWREIVKGTTAAVLIERLRETYELDEQTATRDVEAFVSMMSANDLLLSSSDAPNGGEPDPSR